MIQTIKKPVSILLSLIMVFSVFAIVPITASAAVGDFVPESEYLTFTAEEDNSSVTLKYANGTLKYNINNSGWVDYTKGAQIDLASAGDSVRFRGKDTTFDYSNHVSVGGKVACSGNVMSLRLDDNGKSQGLSYDCFDNMFMDCTGLTAAPELPETNLAEGCYYCMFYGCTSLTTAPVLPATTLATYCYYGMFAGCTSLTTAPVLPATMLEYGCYSSMFSTCTSLTTAPELPATMLAQACYSGMFSTCTSLTTAPELPATMLESGCYSGMFYGCERLTTAPELPATTLAEACYFYMFYDCTSLTTAPELPATTLAPSCYDTMFAGCSSIKLSETKTDEYSIPYSVPSGGNGTTADYALDNMFAETGGTFKGTPTINTTYYRPLEKYTVTWKNEDGTILKTEELAEGTTPTYDGTTPEKAEDENNTYTFSGWTPAVTAVTGDAAYTATYTRKGKHLFAGHSITLGGDIGVNFYVDPTAVDADITGAESAIVKFSFDKYTSSVNLKELTPEENGWYKATCNIPAAYMAHKIHAEVYINGEKQDETNDYSVQEYAETVLAGPSRYDSEKPEALAALVKEMLNYGEKAQTVFSGQMDDAAEYHKIANYTMADVTAEMIQNAIDSNPANDGKTATDMSTVQPEAGAAYYTTSLVFLSRSTLRHYFAIPDGSADPGAYDGNQLNYFYYVEKTDIPAKELDDLQEFTVNGVTFYYSALDYAKAVVESNMADSAKDLAKSLYLYNQAANAYFD